VAYDTHYSRYFYSAVAANAATLLMQSSASNGPQPPAKKLFPAPSNLEFAELASNAAASGDLNFPRRERFVFRPSHLEILEKYFQDNNYPSYETRDEIALACNSLSETAGDFDVFLVSMSCHEINSSVT
jgi:Homeodomain